MTKKTIHNVLTGEIQNIDMTPTEEQHVVEKEKNYENNIELQKNKLEEHAALKASAREKLIAGEKLTEEEANILVGV